MKRPRTSTLVAGYPLVTVSLFLLDGFLGYLFTALWTLSIAIPLLQRSRLLGVTGAVFAIGILAGLLEPFGFGWAGSVNAIAYIAWSVWMVAFGITIWRAAKPATINR